MVKHIVFLKLKDFAEGKSKSENAAVIAEKLMALKDKIIQIKKIEVGVNAPAASKQNFDVALITEFENFEQLEVYINHPEHLKVGDFVGRVRDIRACVDFEF
jgi:putative methionine-R-sulfoxide reductase with GAF domain